ncbi:MAG: hypothetical protein HYX59_14935 [Elusimicrobia bacterium]|nr:hypothetical protein [Elusimicrobiota bacterium]
MKNLKVSGNLDIQTTSARNVTDFVTRPNALAGGSGPGVAAHNQDRIGHANARLIVKMDWDLLDDVHSRVTLVKGAEGVGAGPSARVYGAAPDSIDGITAETFLQEANVKIDKVFGYVDVTAGRQFYGEEGDLIIYYGPRDAYGMRVDALDIFRADWNGEHMSVTGIAGKTSDLGTVTGVGTTATDLRGIVVSCKMHEMVKPSAYVYNRVTHGTANIGIGQTLGSVGSAGNGKNTNLWVAGVKAKVATGGFTGSLELAKNFGEDRTTYAGNAMGAQSANFKGYAVQLKAGYKLDLSDVGAVNPWGEYGMGTGDSNFDYAGNNTFQSINTDYRPGGIYGRFDNGAAIALANGASGNGANAFASNGLSNRIIWGLGVKATPSALNKLTVGAAFYRYAYHRVAPFNANGTKSSRNIGSEVDVTAEWKHSENVSFKATAGSFKPGAAMADFRGANAALNPAVMLAGDVAIKF